jgi:hypothetical protein
MYGHKIRMKYSQIASNHQVGHGQIIVYAMYRTKVCPKKNRISRKAIGSDMVDQYIQTCLERSTLG